MKKSFITSGSGQIAIVQDYLDLHCRSVFTRRHSINVYLNIPFSMSVSLIFAYITLRLH